MNVETIGEDKLIQHLVAELTLNDDVLVGPSDDCAVTTSLAENQYLLHKVDSVLEGIHFTKGEVGHRVGWKAVARVMSDFAAMGGRGKHLVIALSCPKTTSLEWLKDLYVGANACAQKFGACIVGGETSENPDRVVVSVAGTGIVRKEQLKLRSTAHVGDVICTTGKLGGSISGKHLDFQPRCAEGEWLGAQDFVTAMMDLSDGLAKDLPRLTKLSQCGAMLNFSAIPINDACTLQQALGDGEDYELLFTVRAMELDSFMQNFTKRFPHVPITAIGCCVETHEGMTFDAGWEHFTK